MAYAYLNCLNLSGNSVCGANVTNMYMAYENCKNLSAGNHTWNSSKVTNACRCYASKNFNRRINLRVPANSTTLNTVLINNASSIVGLDITWTKSTTYWYNTAYNIRIYTY